MKIGILGSKDVGQTLAKAFKQEGHEVMIGSREPTKLAEFSKENEIEAADFAVTATFAELIVLAVKGDVLESVIDLAQQKNFAKKIIIDTTNPLDFSTMPPKMFTVNEGSLGKKLQILLPQAKVVKAFNMIGAPHMYKPEFAQGPPTMLIAGNDTIAKHTVTELLHDFGWDVMDAGDISCSHYLECVAMIWINHYFSTKNGNHAFKLLRK